mmetsp:Transcript_27991/g.94268  ORF Transcript_27991/g.94268 Transcript_27991/m.94268 type:complete len:206 (+) Transcript_27991:803-1420(+)
MMTTATAGSAADEPCASATVLTHAKTNVSGSGKAIAERMAFKSQDSPPSWRYSRPATKPQTGAVTVYSVIIAVRMAPRFVGMNTPEMAQSSSAKVTKKSWAPAPTKAARRLTWSGNRKTSPLMSFHPVSSSPISSSSTSMYREKSFFKTRIMMMVRNAVRSSTKTKELMMESQWISNVPGRNRESWYRDMRWPQTRSGRGTHSTE